ncbi:hypothetical protein ISN44_As07g016080 [Arabidopsis suecica]|uniref:Secreted protein n=1 Tax=Arabidopsis suecica TaxID=45249 RepID=A0A8T2BUK7_ARASU|nr:hypothetical protein ISN44_As07g016080 [Arabidopsis suecica]
MSPSMWKKLRLFMCLHLQLRRYALLAQMVLLESRPPHLFRVRFSYLSSSLSCGLHRSHDRFRRNQALGVTDFTCTEWCKKQMENVICIGRRKVNRELENKSPATDCRSGFGLLSKIGAKPSFGNLHTFKV